MFSARSESDKGENIFSPDGRLLQIEYAMESTKLGSTAIGIQTEGGVVLAVEKQIPSSLLELKSIRSIFEVDKHVGCAVSGLVADSRTIIDHARIEAQNHWFTYNECVSVESITKSVSNLARQYSAADSDLNAMSRPFGVALLVAGVDEKGSQLFHLDPSGSYIRCLAKAIGSASEGAHVLLEDKFHSSMTLEEAAKCVLEILNKVMQKKLTAANVEVVAVTKADNYRSFTNEDIKTYIKELRS